jgi:predicted transcriptional regulator
MSAMFAGASRAFLTSIIFALETTSQSNALLPLLATCGASYIVSFFLMENTIMTEKIARRGIKTPDSYEPDILEKITVGDVMEKNGIILSDDNSIQEVLDWLQTDPIQNSNYYIISNAIGEYKGIVSSSTLFSKHHKPETLIGSLIKRKHISINIDNSLRKAIEKMASENIDVLPVLSKENEHVLGILSYKNIISSYKHGIEEHTKKSPDISLKRRGLKILVRGQKIISAFRKDESNTG